VRGLLRRGRRMLRANRRLMKITRFAALAIFNQRLLVFRPDRRDWGTPNDLGVPYRVEELPAGTHAVRAWWMPRVDARTAVVLFHGRASNISRELDAIEYLWRLGASVLAIDYPGFGASRGTATERGCHEAAEAAWRAILDKGFAPANVILYGRSLGANIAARLASVVACRALVFHGGASSMGDVGEQYLPAWVVRRFCRIPLDTTAAIGQCRCHVLVVHARDDRLVPLSAGRRVFDAASGTKRMIEVPGDHFEKNWLRHAELRAAWRELIDG
jgi:uncharacterized protein